MNLESLCLNLSIFGCPIIAGIGAAENKASWFTVLFVLGGLAVGLGFCVVISKMADVCYKAGTKKSAPSLEALGFLSYFIVTLGLVAGAWVASGWLSTAIAKLAFG